MPHPASGAAMRSSSNDNSNNSYQSIRLSAAIHAFYSTNKWIFSYHQENLRRADCIQQGLNAAVKNSQLTFARAMAV